MFKVIYYCYLMYSATFGICLVIYRGLVVPMFFSGPGLVWQAVLKKAKVKLNQLSDINMLLLVETAIIKWNIPYYSSICEC